MNTIVKLVVMYRKARVALAYKRTVLTARYITKPRQSWKTFKRTVRYNADVAQAGGPVKYLSKNLIMAEQELHLTQTQKELYARVVLALTDASAANKASRV